MLLSLQVEVWKLGAAQEMAEIAAASENKEETEIPCGQLQKMRDVLPSARSSRSWEKQEAEAPF